MPNYYPVAVSSTQDFVITAPENSRLSALISMWQQGEFISVSSEISRSPECVLGINATLYRSMVTNNNTIPNRVKTTLNFINVIILDSFISRTPLDVSILQIIRDSVYGDLSESEIVSVLSAIVNSYDGVMDPPQRGPGDTNHSSRLADYRSFYQRTGGESMSMVEIICVRTDLPNDDAPVTVNYQSEVHGTDPFWGASEVSLARQPVPEEQPNDIDTFVRDLHLRYSGTYVKYKNTLVIFREAMLADREKILINYSSLIDGEVEQVKYKEDEWDLSYLKYGWVTDSISFLAYINRRANRTYSRATHPDNSVCSAFIDVSGKNITVRETLLDLSNRLASAASACSYVPLSDAIKGNAIVSVASPNVAMLQHPSRSNYCILYKKWYVGSLSKNGKLQIRPTFSEYADLLNQEINNVL